MTHLCMFRRARALVYAYACVCSESAGMTNKGKMDLSPWAYRPSIQFCAAFAD